MSNELSREVGLLRTLAASLDLRSKPPPTKLNIDYLRAESLAMVHPFEEDMLAVRRGGGKAFEDLCECLAERSPEMERGAVFSDVRAEVFTALREYVGRVPSTIGVEDATALHSRFAAWFSARAKPSRVFVPCIITPWGAPRFAIGPVTFVFVEDAARSDFAPSGDDEISRMGFDDLLQLMKSTKSDWLARAAISGCDRKRAEEVADLAVDLALTGLQLIVPLDYGCRTMARLDVRRGYIERRTLSETDGYYNAGWSRQSAGNVIGAGTLAELLKNGADVVEAVGQCVQGFATGRYRLPNLERAWCDAAYWLHEALAEPMDAIAVAKLETALEIFLRTEKSSGSQARVEALLAAFYGLSPQDPIGPGAETTTGQFARRFVKERSRVLHGTWPTLNSRLAMSRRDLEQFVVAVVRHAAVELNAYAAEPSPEDLVEAFLAWVKTRSAIRP